MGRRFGVLSAVLTLVVAGLVGTAAPVLARPAPPERCAGVPVVVLHDFAAGTRSVQALADAVRRDGRCVHVLAHGSPRALAGTPLDSPALLGGLDSLERSATQVAPALARLAGRRGVVDVVGVGAGSLVALRHLQTAALPVRVRTLVGVGALWRGTNLAGLGSLEQQSRDAGTYDLVLPIEQLLLDPVCASCREVLRGSDFMRLLRRDGLRQPGTRTVSILSRDDGLVVPWTSGRLPGTRTHVLQDLDPTNDANHLELATDPLVLRLVRAELRRSAERRR